MIRILNLLVIVTLYMLFSLRIAIFISLFIPPNLMGREGLFPLIKEMVEPLYKLFGRISLGPLSFSPVVTLTIINILMYAMS